MNLTARQSSIVDIVQGEGFATVEALAGSFGVTTQTIRRDLRELCDRGVLRRRHGGVDLPVGAENLPYLTRQVLNLRQKRTIAALVADYVPDGASLAFSIGTTPEVVAQALLGHRGLRIFTNNINVAMVAAQNASFEVTVAGGRLRNSDMDVLGLSAEDFFAAYKVDFGVFGVGGVDSDGSLLDFTEDEVRVRQSIRDNSRQSLLVLDYTKFGRSAHVRGGSIEEISVVFCDQTPPPGIQALLARSQTKLILSEEAAA